MKLEVTRDVVVDLWPLCRAGEASADSRALVDDYLTHDGALAAELKESEMRNPDLTPLHLSPDAERQYLDNARTHARQKMLVMLAGIVVGGIVLLVALNAAMVAVRLSAFRP
jgi:hypothetical protein